MREREDPIRAENLSREGLSELARGLAEEQQLAPSRKGDRRLFQRFEENAIVLDRICSELFQAAQDQEVLSSGAEWLIDNYYIIQEQIRDIRRDFPHGYYHTLPKLAEGAYAKFPRAYQLAVEVVAHTDSSIYGETLAAFIQGFQGKAVLETGELWAIPSLLRLVLIENLRRLAVVNLEETRQRKEAESLAGEIIGPQELKSGTDALLSLATRLHIDPHCLRQYSVHLMRRLREQGPKAGLTLRWIEERLREEGHDPDELLRLEQHRQAANQISIGNAVSALRRISGMNWSDWVEGVSEVHRALASDPLGKYEECDFATRDWYRHSIERLARAVKKTEVEIARAALLLAESAVIAQGSDVRMRHVGYFLSGNGLAILEREVGYQSSGHRRLGSFGDRHAVALYLGAIATLTAMLLAGLFEFMRGQGGTLLEAWLATFVAAIPLSDLACNIVQWACVRGSAPSFLPKLEMGKIIPAEHKTIVAIQAILQGKESVLEIISDLEVRYLANGEENLSYALLADLRDAEGEEIPEDDEVISYAELLVRTLNERHFRDGPGRFFLLFRRRVWNPVQGIFMGWERKRGKIEEFNRFLLDRGVTTFRMLVGEASQLRGAAYVITLDCDSQLPRGVAKKLIGTIAHPLNRPRLDLERRIVVEGYGIIQPRIGIALTSARASRFAAVFCGHAGLDPYTQLVSDVYQDLFHEGSFCGKGIYDVRAFELALRDRVPENQLLSHDLFEGGFARVGLASDIELFDGFPSRYHAFAKRLHRWVRGDWQLLPWMLGYIPDAQGKKYRSPLSVLSRWKLLDNLRRSLVAPCCFLLFCGGAALLPVNTLLWILMLVLVIAFPVYGNAANALLIPTGGISVMSHARAAGRDFVFQSKQAFTALSFLSYQTFLMLHAIGVTLYRVLISHRDLLEWEPASHAERRLGVNLSAFLRQMGPGVALALMAAVMILLCAPSQMIYASPLLLLWAASPFLARWLSAPIPRVTAELGVRDRERLLSMGWETWRYFDEQISPENNYLAPDNIQLTPYRTVATRTSPTNIGLSILSVISAYDLGYLSLVAATVRLGNIMQTLGTLERVHGHFLNWYDTKTRESLAPRYVSAVDSGNLVGHLIAAKNAVESFRTAPLVTLQRYQHLARRLEKFRLIAGAGRDKFKSVSVGLADLLAQAPSVGARGLLVELEVVSEFLNATLDGPEFLAPSVLGDFELFRRELAELLEVRPLLLSGNQSKGDDPGATLHALRMHHPENAAVGVIADTLELFIEGAQGIIREVDFGFLFDTDKQLFTIGFHVDNGRRDSGFYDLHASEARLMSFVAIATGQVPQKHWFMLGRTLVNAPGGAALASWTGTMFEYLMPLLVMRDYPGTLLSETCRAVVATQQLYAAGKGLPWGISESAYGAVDFERTYQYKAFGVPSLGLKRGLGGDLVISPYSTFLALAINSAAAMENLDRLEKEGARGEYGFYEAIDYTPERLRSGESRHVVESYLALHQGMSLVAINNALQSGVMQERFHRDPWVRATDLLLQERFPDALPVAEPKHSQVLPALVAPNDARVASVERFTTPHTQVPRTRVLSNGRYSVLVDNAGIGFSSCDRDISLTRWREDALLGQYGTFIYLRDLENGKVWSAAYHPSRVEPEFYEVLFSPDKVEFNRRDAGITLHTEIAVSPEDQVEVRRVTISNVGNRHRSLEITSFGEVALGNMFADSAHPAFAKMFIESEFDAELDALLFARRPRSKHEETLFLMHTMALDRVVEPIQYETSRAAFIGRGRSIANPLVFTDRRKLSKAVGSIIDPIFSLRTRVELDEGTSNVVVFVTGFAKSRTEIRALAERYRDQLSVTRAFEMAWSQSSIELRHEQFSVRQVHAFQRLITALLFNIEGVRGSQASIATNRLTQSGFWRFGVSGDLPIVYLTVSDPGHVKLVRELVLAHQYIRMHGISFELVILNKYPGGYLQSFQEELDFLVRSGYAGAVVDKKGGIFLRTLSALSAEELCLLEAVARVVLVGARGLLSSQLLFGNEPKEPSQRRRANLGWEQEVLAETSLPASGAPEKGNGIGDFLGEGGTYQIILKGKALPPQPWSNVIANPSFGFLVTESGGGFTWSQNSHENRLSPWSNDPIGDMSGEILYLRDVDRGNFWSATPRPISPGGTSSVTHSFGETCFIRNEHEVTSRLTISGSVADRVKFWNLTLSNTGGQVRTLEVFLYVEWVLGVQRSEGARMIVADFDVRSQSLHARNYYNNEFAGATLYLGSTASAVEYTTSRAEFLGRHGDHAHPRILVEGGMGARSALFSAQRRARVELSQKVGAGFDSCGVLKVDVVLAPHAKRELVFFMGEESSAESAKKKALHYGSLPSYRREREQAHARWESDLGAIRVRTPNRGFDLMVNGWLLYQTISSRIHGRSGVYQSGGAIGFRDQLQDSLALLWSHPERTREQILLHASHQFPEGDVQHWWHPPTGRGVRTRISDDYLWLPFAVARYLEATEERGVLEEQVPFVEGPKLDAQEMEIYMLPQVTRLKMTLYEHCILALDRASALGVHGLPLIGGGDWNDGMNEVGREGKGESVWLAWFLSNCLRKFAPLARDRGEIERAKSYEARAEALVGSIDEHSWDGSWYRRAYFDDGTPLGSAESEECKIDSLVQSWSVIAGGGRIDRQQAAMSAVRTHLVNESTKVVRLLAPPFNRSSLDPGYIKGYLPGIRENGGQYTHAAVWYLMATALQGKGKEAFELFDMINPITHTSTKDGVARYQAEPYVLCGDVYAEAPHEGRGGWSWYTGSAGWMYQVAIEQLVGLKVRGSFFTIEPCVPPDWKEFSFEYCRRGLRYQVSILNPDGVETGVVRIEADGRICDEKRVRFIEESAPRDVRVVVHMGASLI